MSWLLRLWYRVAFALADLVHGTRTIPAIMPATTPAPIRKGALETLDVEFDEDDLLDHERDVTFLRLLRHALACDRCVVEPETSAVKWRLCRLGREWCDEWQEAERARTYRDLTGGGP